MCCAMLLTAVTLAVALTVCAGDPNLLQGRPFGVNGLPSSHDHHHQNIQRQNPFQEFRSGGGDHLLLQSNDASYGLEQGFDNQGFQASVINNPIILGGRSQADGAGTFHFGRADDAGTFQFGRADGAGTFQFGRADGAGAFGGVQGGFQTGPNIFADNNVLGGVAQQFGRNLVTVTSTTDRYVTTTDLAFNSLPVTFTNFNKRIVTRTTNQVLPTPVNDKVFVTSRVVHTTSTLTVTHLNTVVNFVTRTTQEVYPITHTLYDIVYSTYTSVLTQRMAMTSTIVHTNILTDTITVTDRRYVTDYHYVPANY